MSGLYSIPQEILIEILANCESPRVVAKFAATCKLVNSTWVTFAPSILKRIGRKSILYYDTALIVVCRESEGASSHARTAIDIR